jgi:hypothetical protein
MDNSIDAITSIYELILTRDGKVIECEREENFVTIEIVVFDDPMKDSLYDHDHHVYQFQLSPEDNGLACNYQIEQEQWAHY